MQGDFILHIKLYIGVSSTMGPFYLKRHFLHSHKSFITNSKVFVITFENKTFNFHHISHYCVFAFDNTQWLM